MRYALLLLTTSLFAQPEPHGLADCTKLTGYDTIIVGAGLAGLSAAHELTQLHHSVLILEAADRIGGRARVADINLGSGTAPIDYGGAWLHGVATNPLTGLVDALGFHRFRSELDAPYYLDGRRANHDQTKLLDAALADYEHSLSLAAAAEEGEQAILDYACSSAQAIKARSMTPQDLCAQLRRVMPDKSAANRLCTRAQSIVTGLDPRTYCAEARRWIRVTNDSAQDYLPPAARFKALLPLIVGNAGPLETAVELKNSSAVDAARFAAGEDDLTDRGLGAFVAAYGKDAPVCTNSSVTRVTYSDNGVTVQAGDRQYQAAAALVTVSVGVLQAKRIAFDPPLSNQKQDAISKLRMGNMQKVIIPFTRDIFPDELPNSWVLSEDAMIPDEQRFAAEHRLPGADTKRRVMAFVIKPLNTNLAIGFFGGDWARALESQCDGKERTSGPRSPSGCDDLSMKIATAALSHMYGDKAVADAIQPALVHLTRWSLDETSLGAYSAPLPGYWDQREILREPVERLFFAGEATARPIYNGSYPGAYESGIDAARAIHVAIH